MIKDINNEKIKPEVKKNQEKKMKKYEFISMIIGFVICAVLMVVSIIVINNVVRLSMLPNKYLIAMCVALTIMILMLVLLQRWFVSGIAAKVLAIFLIVVLVMGNSYLVHTYKRINDMTGIKTQIDNVNVYVLTDNPADSLQQAADYKFGILTELDRNNTDIVITEVNETVGKSITTVEYASVVELVEALYAGEVDSIIMNSAYVAIVTAVEDYTSFESETRVLVSKEIESELKDSKVNDEYLYNGDKVFTMYISGIDTRGNSPRVNSNSDVNILMTVNMETRQILLISTPRDFYVPLSISGGVRDKLTHAGGYGIDVSVDTLEMLYGVNIDDYLKINFTGFIDVIDELDGVNVYSEYDFKSGKYSYHKGYNELNGEEALEFARTRKAFIDGDRQRGKNQMAVIEAIIKKMATSDTLKNYENILDSLADSMVTSMEYDEIADIVKFQLNDMKSWDVVKYSVTGFDSSNTTFSAGSQMLYVMVPDESTVNKAKQYISQIYNNERVVLTND